MNVKTRAYECRYCRRIINVPATQPAPEECKNCGGPYGPVRRKT